jgi:hypothetical protein
MRCADQPKGLETELSLSDKIAGSKMTAKN